MCFRTGAPTGPAVYCSNWRCMRVVKAASICLLRRPRLTKTQFRFASSLHFREVRRWSGASRAWSAGTLWRWWCAPTRSRTASAAISRRSPRPRPCMKSPSIIFSARSTEDGDRDMVYFQGHAAPGMYSRAFLEGRMSEREAAEFPPRTKRRRRPVFLSASLADAGFLGVSHGLDGTGPDQGHLSGALHQVPGEPRLETADRRQGVGISGRRRDGRAGIAGRDHAGLAREARQPDLRRQLQPAAARRPVRGNGKIIQELEAVFRGAGWNVIKVIWGSDWDPLFANDRDGLLVKRMGESVDGEYQKYFVETGAYIRQNFFGTDPRLLEDGRASVRRAAGTHAPRRPRSASRSMRLTRPPSITRARPP